MNRFSALRWCLSLMRKNIIKFILLTIFSTLLGVCVVSVSIIMKLFMDIATGANTIPLYIGIIISCVTLLILGFSQIMTCKYQGKLFSDIEIGVRNTIVKKIYSVYLLTFDSNPSNFYFTRLTKDTEIISNFFSNTLVSNIFFECFTFLISLILMFVLEWRLTTVLAIIVPILIFIMIKISPKLELYNKLILTDEEENRNVIQDFLNRYLLFKSYGMQKNTKQKINDSYEHKRKNIDHLSITKGLIGFLNNFLGVGMFIIALSFGAFLVANGKTTVGTLVAVVNLVSFYYGPFLHISGWLSDINSVKASVNRIGEILSMPTENVPDDKKYEKLMNEGEL